MRWSWGPGNWLWQVVHRPLQLLDAAYAKQWYAQSSATNWGQGGWHRVVSVIQDASGGYIASWFGSAQSSAQAWWSVGFSVPSFFFGGASLALRNVLNLRTAGAALYKSVDALSGGQQLGLLDATLSLVGLGSKLSTGEAAFKLLQIPNRNMPLSPLTFHKVILGEQLALNSNAWSFVSWMNKGFAALEQSARHSITQSAGVDVGGVLFEKCATLLPEVRSLRGAYWDRSSGSLVLLGEGRSESGVTHGLSIDRDHFIVALRAAIAGQPIGVSIDPPGEYRDGIKRGVVPPDGTPMLVSYLGETEGTLFGAVMFEADRLLKCMDKGTDNKTRKPVRASISGFKPLLEMMHPGNERSSNVWHRLWFVIEKVELKQDAATEAIAFGDVRLKVLNETEMHDKGKNSSTDPAVLAFAQHLSENYDEYAKEFPILARLKELAKVAALAKFLVRKNVPLDLGDILSSKPQTVATPSTTPAISVTSPNVEVRQEGNVIHKRSVSLFGGVDMDAEPTLMTDDGSASQLYRAAEASRPFRGSTSWKISNDGRVENALSVKIGRSHSTFRRTCLDHSFSNGASRLPLELRRAYSSNLEGQGDFGPGWKLWIPFSMSVVRPSQKRADVLTRLEKEKHRGDPVLFLHDSSSSETNIYRRVESNNSGTRVQFCRVRSQDLGKQKLSFQYDPSDHITSDVSGFFLTRKGLDYRFDGTGALVEIRADSAMLVRYRWCDWRITQIEYEKGQAYQIEYSRSEPLQIVNIKCNNGELLSYDYDDAGCLLGCRRKYSQSERYSYDLNRRLTETRNASGEVVSRAVYDAVGHVATGKSIASDGLIREFSTEGHLLSVTTDSGDKVNFRYGRKGELSVVLASDHSQETCELKYDSSGRLTDLRDKLGQLTRLNYDASGHLYQVVDPSGKSQSFEHTGDGRLAAIKDQKGRRSRVSYDRRGRVSVVHGPGNQRWQCVYAGPLLLRLEGPDNELRLVPRRNTLVLRIFAGNEVYQEHVFDHNLRLVRSITRGAPPLDIAYDATGQVASLRNEAGCVAYQSDPNELTTTVSFQ